MCLQVDLGINWLCSSSAEDEASKPLHSFDKNLFDLCKVPADQIAVSIHLLACLPNILIIRNRDLSSIHYFYSNVMVDREFCCTCNMHVESSV